MSDKARILVIDDEAVIRAGCERLFARDGHEVSGAASGEEALEKLAACHYDLALLDLRLPPPGGLTVLRCIKDAYPRTGVIVITGYASIDNAKAAICLGAFDYLRKPLDPNRLRSAVSQALASKHRTTKEVTR